MGGISHKGFSQTLRGVLNKHCPTICCITPPKVSLELTFQEAGNSTQKLTLLHVFLTILIIKNPKIAFLKARFGELLVLHDTFQWLTKNKFIESGERYSIFQYFE